MNEREHDKRLTQQFGLQTKLRFWHFSPWVNAHAKIEAYSIPNYPYLKLIRDVLGLKSAFGKMLKQRHLFHIGIRHAHNSFGTSLLNYFVWTIV